MSLSQYSFRTHALTTLAIAFACLLNSAHASGQVPQHARTDLQGWQLQSGCIETSSGDRISSSEYHPDPGKAWIPALVPGTVLGAQVAAREFTNPYFGMNLRSIPGTDYPISKIFGYLAMPTNSPYRCPWWYRVEFAAVRKPETFQWLHFDGINYRANLWLNGKQIANSDDVAGAFRSYDFNITSSLRADGNNVLAVQVFAQTEKDLGIDFLDWNPAPADKSMGLWRNVSLSESRAVTIGHPEVITHFPEDNLSEAELTVVADVTNHSDHAVTTVIQAKIGPRELSQSITLDPMESRIVHFSAGQFAQLRWKHPPIWWPYEYGEPHLEKLSLTAAIGSEISDRAQVDFGIREVDSFLDKDGFRQFRINHRDILIRGAGWTPDLLYREPPSRLEEELEYVRAMHLNAIRLEGKLGSDVLFDLADRMGILVLPGWQCCDYWQKMDAWSDRDRQIAIASLHSQIDRLRAHASMLAWLNGSDEAPAPEIERAYLTLLKEREWPNPVLSAAADRDSTISGKTGVKMTGPYDYVPPEYWYLDHDRYGGAYGFNMETSPGPAPPIAASIRRTLPEASWWPIDKQWNYHAGLGKFAQLDTFTRAMAATYGPASTLDEYAQKAQLMAYDGERAMFEAYGARKYRATGVIQWMLNNAWPSFIWHLYDYYLVPGGGYFGTRKANEPLHIQYRYDDRLICVVNSTLHPYHGLHARILLLGLDGKALYSSESLTAVDADGVVDVSAIPEQTATTFLKLELRNADDVLVSDNFYWLPAKLSEMRWEKTTYVNTPATRYADMRDLNTIPAATVHMMQKKAGNNKNAEVELYNSGKTIAFFLSLRAVKAGTDEDIVPIFWSDNYISLLPDERRTLTVSGLSSKESSELKLTGWNVALASLHLMDLQEAQGALPHQE